MTLDILQQYRDFMTLPQLEKYAQYVKREIPILTFSEEEIQRLKDLRDKSINAIMERIKRVF